MDATGALHTDHAGSLPQLPTDFSRSGDTPYHPAALRWGVNDLVGDLITGEGDARALIVAATSALVYRYTQQDVFEIACELRGVVGFTGTEKRRFQAHFDEAATARTITATARRALGDSGDAAPSPAGETASSPIVITFTPDPSIDAADGRPEMHLVVCAAANGFAGRVTYNAALFKPETVERFVAHLGTLLRQMCVRPDQPIATLPVLADAELRRLALDGDGPMTDGPLAPVHDIFGALAAVQPDALAATFQARRLTYRELETRSNQLANHLIAAGVEPETRVAVCLPPSFDVLVSMLAVFKAGATYVPLDPTHPEVYQTRILREARPRLVLTHAGVCSAAQAEGVDALPLDEQWARVAERPDARPNARVTFDTPAYLLYTSGTTGKPKGVLATHGNLSHYIHVARQRYGFDAQDVFCSLARYTFSISLFELVSPLCCGGQVRLLDRNDVLAPDRLTQALREITVVHAGPSLLGSLFQYLRSNPSTTTSFPKMRHASSGGDLVPPSIVEEMKQVFPNAELFVIYGCTEVSCMGLTYPVPRDGKVTRTFVGKPFANVAVRVLDRHRNQTPTGVVGDIYFAGKGVVPGYVDQPELTAERFSELGERRYYQTGDLGRVHPDGNIEILGRSDFQVQLRGIRVELAGIENVVREVRLADQCAVVVKRLSEQDSRLVAFVVKPQEANTAGFRKVLGAHLPEYMLPQHVVTLDAMPLTANGKLDRKRLVDLPWNAAPEPADGETAPRNSVETAIASVFSKSLGRDPGTVFGIDVDFFDAGGHSLLAVTATQELENVLGTALTPGALFEHATVRSLAEYIQNPSLNVPRPILLSARDDLPPLFLVAGVHIYRPLAKHLGDQFSVYGVYSSSELALFERSDGPPPLADLARDYVQIIRRHQPKGPYRLAGLSFGGVLAYEIAQHLRAMGERVTFLGLLDAILPEPGWRGRLGRLQRILFLPRRELQTFVLDRVQNRLKRVFRSADGARFARYAEDEKLSPLERLREQGYDQAAAAYVGIVRLYPFPATLVVAGRRRHEEQGSPDCGWRRYALGLRVHELDCDHLALLEEPAVKEVADIFRRSMTIARPVAAAPGAPRRTGLTIVRAQGDPLGEQAPQREQRRT
jgi:amino acid adenylation domain-containing protein